MFRLPYLRSPFKKSGELKRFNATDPAARKIVFYAHGAEDWLVLEPVMLELIHQFKQSICYVTNNPDDPIRHMPPLKINPFFINSPRTRRQFLEGMNCHTLVVSSSAAVKEPFPVSPNVKNYAYLCPFLTSIRRVVCQENLKLFNTWLCAAEHQMLDTLKLKTDEGLDCRVFACGSTRFDRTLRMTASSRKIHSDDVPTAFFSFTNPDLKFRDCVCAPVIEKLLDAGMRVIFRSPDNWVDRKGRQIRPLYERFTHRDLFFPDGEQPSNYSIYQTDLIVTDDSESAIELGLALEYPVILLDTGEAQGSSLSKENFEHDIPDVLGSTLPISSLDALPTLAKDCIARRVEIADTARRIRLKELLNPGQSAITAALILTGNVKILREPVSISVV